MKILLINGGGGRGFAGGFQSGGMTLHDIDGTYQTASSTILQNTLLLWGTTKIISSDMVYDGSAYMSGTTISQAKFNFFGSSTTNPLLIIGDNVNGLNNINSFGISEGLGARWSVKYYGSNRSSSGGRSGGDVEYNLSNSSASHLFTFGNDIGYKISSGVNAIYLPSNSTYYSLQTISALSMGYYTTAPEHLFSNPVRVTNSFDLRATDTDTTHKQESLGDGYTNYQYITAYDSTPAKLLDKVVRRWTGSAYQNKFNEVIERDVNYGTTDYLWRIGQTGLSDFMWGIDGQGRLLLGAPSATYKAIDTESVMEGCGGLGVAAFVSGSTLRGAKVNLHWRPSHVGTNKVTSGSTIGTFQAWGCDGNNVQVLAGGMRIDAAGTIGNNRVAGKLVFFTHPDSTSAPIDIMTFDENQNAFLLNALAIGTTTLTTSTILDLNSTTKAILITRMTTTQKNALTATNGMQVYDSTLNKFQVYENGAWVNMTANIISKGGTLYNSNGLSTVNMIAWYAPFACTVTNVRGYRVGGTGATINARRNGSSNHLSSALSMTSADTWQDGGTVQNTAYAAGDKLEIMVVSVTGTVTQICIQVDFTK